MGGPREEVERVGKGMDASPLARDAPAGKGACQSIVHCLCGWVGCSAGCSSGLTSTASSTGSPSRTPPLAPPSEHVRKEGLSEDREDWACCDGGFGAACSHWMLSDDDVSGDMAALSSPEPAGAGRAGALEASLDGRGSLAWRKGSLPPGGCPYTMRVMMLRTSGAMVSGSWLWKCMSAPMQAEKSATSPRWMDGTHRSCISVRKRLSSARGST
mmetsp:Transcript_23243/g.58372  ORF Transcript_23243/g.58372 Transcript_23243/m.58372 type:complete len:214 (-) Transcript_23243:237-878(-)